MHYPKVWNLIKLFKNLCRGKGWRTSESHDWVMTEEGYHNFIWVNNVHPSTFKRIALNGKCVVKEGVLYRIVEASYLAWILQRPANQSLITTVSEDEMLSKKVAIYDISPIYSGKPVCFKLNKTDSSVFAEFEEFLEKELGVSLVPIENSDSPQEEEKLVLTREA